MREYEERTTGNSGAEDTSPISKQKGLIDHGGHDVLEGGPVRIRSIARMRQCQFGVRLTKADDWPTTPPKR